jgi:hypothetical protein
MDPTATDTPPATVEVLAQLLDYHCDRAMAAQSDPDPDPDTVRRLVSNLLGQMQAIGFCPPLASGRSDFAAWLERQGWEVDGNIARMGAPAPAAREVA